MKTIKIAHLYYDLLNLYGEIGNILALKKAFEDQGLKVSIDNLSKNAKIDFNEYDIYYMGMGTENNLEIVRQDILRYKTEIKKYLKKKLFISTGNSYELFGKSINDLEALGIFDFKSRTVKKRIVGEQLYKTYIIDKPIIGFQNRGSINDNDENNLFEVIKGDASNQNSKFEGIHIDNFYGTYLVGPLLVRNPHLLNKIVEEFMIKNKLEYKVIDNTPDMKAYNEFIKNFNIKVD